MNYDDRRKRCEELWGKVTRSVEGFTNADSGYTKTGFPERYRHAEASIAEVRRWAKEPIGLLLLAGGVGGGKTYETYGLIRDWLIWRASYNADYTHCVWRMPDLCAVAQDFKRREDLDAARTLREDTPNHALVVLDDVGVEADNHANRETLWRVLDNRYVHCLPTVISTNVAPGDFATRFGARVADRMREDLTLVVFREGSRRGVQTDLMPLHRDEYIARFLDFHFTESAT